MPSSKFKGNSMKKIFALLCVCAELLFGVVNINTAGIEELKTLKGIGEGKAQAIIDYRKDHNFTSIEEIKQVKGIGDKLFQGIKNDIVIK